MGAVIDGFVEPTGDGIKIRTKCTQSYRMNYGVKCNEKPENQKYFILFEQAPSLCIPEYNWEGCRRKSQPVATRRKLPPARKWESSSAITKQKRRLVGMRGMRAKKQISSRNRAGEKVMPKFFAKRSQAMREVISCGWARVFGELDFDE